MNWLHERFASMAPPLLPILLDSAIKGAALLLLTAFAALAMRRASAAARHLVWFLAVAALLFLPFFSVMLPAWHILPAWTQTIAAAPTAAPPSAPRLGAAEGFPPSSSTPSPQTPPPDFADAIPPNTQLLPPLHPPTWQPTAAASPSQSPDAPPIAPTTPQHAATHSHNWQESVLLIWLIGSLLYCLYILLGCLSLRRLARQSSPITDPAWTTALHQARQSLRFRRAVNLITHPLRGMPMTWGLWQAWILLPEDADHWTADQRRAVLLHELAHAKRCDCLTQLITQLAVALYWFNPLLWLAWKRIQTVREQACDDLVLATGQKASTYAEQLLTIAAAMPAFRYPAAIAMARPGRLEQRLVAILDTRRRRRLAATTAIALCLAACTFAAIVATLRAHEPITDPSLAVVTRWANAHGWKTQAVADTNLEQGDGWRNLPFTLDPAEEADAKACAKLTTLAGSSVNGVNQLDEPSTADKLKTILDHRPHYFYAEFLLAEWDRDNRRPDDAAKLRQAAFRDAPVILVQRYAFANGTPLADASVESFAIECNRVQHGYLDPSLLLTFHNLRTDADGCIYLPAYDTVYRTDGMADPDGYSVSYPTLGWFEAKQKVAVLPPAIVTAKPGDFVSTAAPNAPPKSHIVLPGGIGVELFAVSRYPDPTNTWWRPDGSASPIYHTDPPGLSPWPADHGYRLLWRFDKPTPPGDIIQLRFSIPCDATNYFAAVPPAWVGRQTAVFLSFPTHPQKVSIQCGLGTPWKILAACDARAQHLTGALPPGFSLNAQKDPFGIPELIATHGPTDLDFRVLAVDADNREYQATQWGTNVPKAAKPQVIESSFGFRDPASQKIVSYRFETRSYRWSEFTNIALAPTGQRPQIQPTAAATRAVTSPPAFDFAIAQSTGQAATGFGDHLIVGTIAKGAVHTRVHPITFPDKAIHPNFSDSEQFLGVTQNKFFVGNEYGVQTLDLSTGKIEPFPGGMKNLPPMPRADLLIRGNRRVEWGGLANPAYGQPSTRPVDLCDLCVASGAEPPQFILSQTYSEPPSNFLFPKPPTIWLDDDHLLTLRSDDRNGLVGEARYEAVVIDLKTRTSRAVGRITGWPNAMIAPRGDGGDAIVIADSNTGDQSGHSLAKTWSLNVKAALAGTGKLEERPAHWGQFTIEKTTFDYAPDAVGLQRLLYRGKTLATAPVGPGGELVASVSPDGNSALWQIRPPHYPRDWQLYFFTTGMDKPQQIASTGEFGMPIWFAAAQLAPPATQPADAPFKGTLAWLNDITDAQLQEAYDRLPPERRTLVDRMTPRDCKEYLGERYQAAHRPRGTGNSVDPDLLQIQDELEDSLQPAAPLRDQIISYLEHHRQTPFAAELNFDVAMLYSQWAKPQLGDKQDQQLTVLFLQKAHAIYGARLSYENENAWITWAQCTRSIAEMQAHIAWLKKVRAGSTHSDVYPVRNLFRVVRGWPIYLSPSEMDSEMEFFRKANLDSDLQAAEANLKEIQAGIGGQRGPAPATQPVGPAATMAPPVWFTIQPFSPVKSLADEGGGPAIRRVLAVAGGGGMQTAQDRAYLDLDDGEYVPARTLVPSEFEYAKYRKIDLSAQLKGHGLQVVARHMELAKAAPSIENPADASLSLESARRSLADAKRADETALPPGTVYFFRSLQDDIGVLRVSDISAGQPPTATVDYRILYSVPWGNAGKGAQVRLRPEESSWGGGQTPTFTLDIRNTGKSELDCLGIPDLECKFNIDGTWFGYSKPIAIGAHVQQLAPGEKRIGIVPMQLTSAWAQPKSPAAGWPEPGNIDVWAHPLSLAPGPHSLAVAFDNEKPMEPGSETVKALSNTVSFDVAAAPASQPATQPQTPRAGNVWFDIFPSTPVKSLADFGPAFVVLDPASTGDPHATGAVGLEIRSADNSRRVAEIPRMIELRQYLESGGIRLDRDQLRRVGPIADGSYLAALTTTGGARCSQVIRLVIDSKYTPPAEPTLRLEPTPLRPGEKLPAVWLVGTGPRPIDNRLTNASVMFPTLIVDGVKHDPVIPPMGMPTGPIRPGESYAAFARLADFTPPIPPKAQYRVKAKTAGYESAEVTIPAVDSLGPAWDAATARLAPLPPAIPELRGTVIGPDGKPAAGAEIMLQGPTPSGSTAATEHCDANGRYAFVHVPVGKYMLWAEPLRIDSISIQPGKTLVQDFSSVERFKLTGRVTYQNGAPAAGKSVDVTATSNDGKVVFDASADTDAHGRYSVGTPFNNIAGVNLEGTAAQGLFPDPVYGVKASAAPVNLVIPANAPGTTQPAEADRWGVLRPGLSYRLSTPHDPWPIGEKPIVWLDVKNTTSAAQHLLDGGAVALRLAGLPKDETVRLTYRTGNDVLIKPGDSVTFAITFPAKLLKPGRYPVRCAFVPNPKDAAPGKGGFRACPPLILATVAPAPPVPTSGPATQPALRDPWGRVGDFARYRLVPPAGAISTHDPVTAVLEIENIGRNPLPLAERNMGNFFADVAGWQWDETYDPTTWTAGDPKTGRDTGKPIGSVPAGGRELLFIHFNEKLPLAGKYELECGFAPAPQFEAPQSRAMPVGLFVVEPGQSAAPDVDPADHSRAAWGPAVDHMQARMYRRDPIHDGGDIDDLTIELRNVGDRQMAFDPSLGAVELEIDGKWYHAGSTSRHPARLLPFGPGIRWYDWASMYLSWSPGLDPTADWRDADGQSLRLAHGKHTVRLAITLPPMPGSGGSPVRLLTNAVERNTTRDFGSATPLPFMDANQPPNPPPAPATQPNPLPDATQPAANPALSSGPWHTRLPCGVTVELVGVSTNPSSDHSWWRPDGSPMAHPPAHAPSPADVGTAIAPAYEFAIFVDNVPFAHETGDFQIIDKIEAHPDPFGHDGTSSVSGNWFPRPSPDLKVQPIMHLILQSFAPTEDRTTVWLGISGGPWKAIGDNVTNGKAQAESRMGINGTRIDISYAAPYEALWQANLPKNMPNREDMATFIDVAENLPADQQVRVAAILTSGKEVLSDKNPEVTDGHVHQVMARFRNVSISEIKLFRLESRPFQWTEFKDIPLRPNAATTQPSGRAFAPSAR